MFWKKKWTNLIKGEFVLNFMLLILQLLRSYYYFKSLYMWLNKIDCTRLEEYYVYEDHYLNNIIKDLEQEEHQVVIGDRWEKEPWRTKCFQEMQQFRTGHHR